MVMYAIGTLPLIHRLDGIAKETWYADDSAAALNLEKLRRLWDTLSERSWGMGVKMELPSTGSWLGNTLICWPSVSRVGML